MYLRINLLVGNIKFFNSCLIVFFMGNGVVNNFYMFFKCGLFFLFYMVIFFISGF